MLYYIIEVKKMNYYGQIKNEIIDIGTYKRVKDYSKNKNIYQTTYLPIN